MNQNRVAGSLHAYITMAEDTLNLFASIGLGIHKAKEVLHNAEITEQLKLAINEVRSK